MKDVNRLFLDIETIPADNCNLFKPVFTEPRLTKKNEPDKRDKTVEEQESEWRNKLALSPLTGQIACYGYIKSDGAKAGYQEHDVGEKDLLGLLVEYIKEADFIIGHFVKDFDLPFIFNRCRKYGIEFPHKHYSKYKGKFSWKDSVICTNELWNCGKYPIGKVSLNNLAKFFGLQQKDESVSENFAGVWFADRERAVQHAIKDVILTKQVYERLTKDA